MCPAGSVNVHIDEFSELPCIVEPSVPVIKKVSDKSRKNMSIEVVKSQEKLRKV